MNATDTDRAREMAQAACEIRDQFEAGATREALAQALHFFADAVDDFVGRGPAQAPAEPNILWQLNEKIHDAIDGARSAGAALARSAHEIQEVAHYEDPPTCVGTAARADRMDQEGVRVMLTAVHLSRVDGMLSAYGTVLRMLDDAREGGGS